MGQPYDQMSLEELQAEQQRLNGEIAERRQQLRDMTPYIDAAVKEADQLASAQSDPALKQVVGFQPRGEDTENG